MLFKPSPVSPIELVKLKFNLYFDADFCNADNFVVSASFSLYGELKLFDIVPLATLVSGSF